MSGSFEVRGTEALNGFSKALKAAGETEMRKSFHKGIRQAAKPLVPVAKQAAAEAFPKRGGLAAREAKIKFTPKFSTGKVPGVKITAPGKYVVGKTTNASGTFRHPIFADSSKTRRQWRWVTQRRPIAGWFDNAMRREAPRIRHDLERVLGDLADQIIQRGRHG